MCDVVESCTGTTLAECSAVAIQEECRNFGRSEISERGATIRQIRLKRAATWCAEECDALLVALPRHLHLATAELQVAHADRNHFSNAKSGAVEQLNECGIAQGQRR